MSEMWTRELVWSRYLEAFDTLRRLPGEGRSTTSWPAIIRDFADAIAAEETRAAEAYPFPPGWGKPAPPSHRAIDRMHALFAWHSKYLSAQEDAARLVLGMAWCKTIGFPLTRFFRGRRIRRRDGYRKRDAALTLVRQGLERDRVPVDAFEHVVAA